MRSSMVITSVFFVSILLAGLAACVAGTPAGGTGGEGDQAQGGESSLQQMIDSAKEGSTLLIPVESFFEEEITINTKGLTICRSSEGKNCDPPDLEVVRRPIIKGAVTITAPNVTLKGFEVRGASTPCPSGDFCFFTEILIKAKASPVTIQDNIVEDPNNVDACMTGISIDGDLGGDDGIHLESGSSVDSSAGQVRDMPWTGIVVDRNRVNKCISGIKLSEGRDGRVHFVEASVTNNIVVNVPEADDTTGIDTTRIGTTGIDLSGSSGNGYYDHEYVREPETKRTIRVDMTYHVKRFGNHTITGNLISYQEAGIRLRNSHNSRVVDNTIEHAVQPFDREASCYNNGNNDLSHNSLVDTVPPQEDEGYPWVLKECINETGLDPAQW
jgi:parallel beta-helix repeat protein